MKVARQQLPQGGYKRLPSLASNKTIGNRYQSKSDT